MYFLINIVCRVGKSKKKKKRKKVLPGELERGREGGFGNNMAEAV